MTFQQSKLWSVRPSQLVGITSDYVAYCYDQAVYQWGIHVESEIEEAGSKKKGKSAERARQNKLNQLLQVPAQQRFKSFRQAAGKAPVKE